MTRQGDWSAERRARLGLCCAVEAGDIGLVRLIRDEGADAVWRHLCTTSERPVARRAREVDLEAVIAATARCGARFIIPGDPEWPVKVDELAWAAPLAGTGGEPLGLWVRGVGDLAEAARRAVAIVGSRASTAYGEYVATEFSSGLTEHGFTVVSGGAYGIDAAAHRGALSVAGLTIAVMAGGLAQFYPPGNARLMGEITSSGVVVSEYPPTRPPSRAQFLIRNRLIAALGQGTVIVEGAMRSGAQNTVTWAMSLGRPILAVPGPVTSATSVTPHRLIRENEAVLVTSVAEVVAGIAPLGEQADPPSWREVVATAGRAAADAGSEPPRARGVPEPSDPPRARGVPEPSETEIMGTLPKRHTMTVDEIVALTNRPVLEVLVSLGQLQAAGLVEESTPGRWRRGGC